MTKFVLPDLSMCHDTLGYPFTGPERSAITRWGQACADAARREAIEECAVLCKDIYQWHGAASAGPISSNTIKAVAAAIRSLK